MRISSSWLQEFVEVPPSEQLAHVFEMAGIGVENFDKNTGVFQLEITSNRGDWLSAIGLAREIAAMTNQRFRAPHLETLSTPLDGVRVEIENPDDCNRYSAMLLENVCVDDSPQWLQDRLLECGMRPVNAIVDATNFVMLERGQPLHAFDADKILDNQIVVRRARDGEKITTLDETERILTSEILVITDAQNPIAIAGVMGGRDSEVTEKTTRVLLESAHFSPTRVRRASRVLGLSSEASRRFARHVDPNGTLQAAARAAQLIVEIAGGKIIPGAADCYPIPMQDAHVSLRVARCNRLLGTSLDEAKIAALLSRLGLKIASQSNGTLQVSVPTRRRDVEREVDLIEEVARIHGYENIPATLPETVNAFAGRNLSQRLEDSARETLVRCGLGEIVTYSLENSAAVARAGLDASTPVVALRNPLNDDYTQLRTSLFPSLLQVLQNNALADANAISRFFEIGKIYCPRENASTQQPVESRHVGIALLGAPPLSHWQKGAQSELDFFALKALVESFLQGIGAPRARFHAASAPPFHPGRCATLSIDGENIGCLGEVHPAVAARYDLRHRAFLAQLDFEALVRHISLVPQYSPVSKQPPADRDIALVVPEKTSAFQIENSVRRAAGVLLESARLFDVYAGAPIESGFKSVALALHFRAADRTLQEAEIESAMTNIRDAAEKELGAKLRM